MGRGWYEWDGRCGRRVGAWMQWRIWMGSGDMDGVADMVGEGVEGKDGGGRYGWWEGNIAYFLKWESRYKGRGSSLKMEGTIPFTNYENMIKQQNRSTKLNE